MTLSAPPFSAIILAGGQGKRMGGRDKGLVKYNNKKFIDYILSTLTPLCNDIIISANRNIETYRQYSSKVIGDTTEGFQGPLAGLAACLPSCDNEWVLVSPCDMPLLETSVFEKLGNEIAGHRLAAATTGQKLQPVFLLQRSLHASIQQALENGQLRLMQWLKSQQPVMVNFSQTQLFTNFNQL